MKDNNKLEVKKCSEWLALQTLIKTVNTRHSSYAYKHMVERWSNIYISEESFLDAVKKLGIPHKNYKGSIYLSLSEKTLKKMPYSNIA